MEDLTLRDFILQIHRYRMFIAIITIIALVTSLIFNFFVLKPFYESAASILVAQFDGGGIFTQSATKDQMETESFLQKVADKLDERTSFVRNNLAVTIPSGSNNTIDISFKSHSREECVDALNTILNLLREMNKEAYTMRISKIESSLNEAKVRLLELQNIKSDLATKIKDLESSQLTEKDRIVDYSILMGTYSSIVQQITDANNAIKDNEIVLMNSNDFQFFVEPSTPIKAGPSVIINVFLTVVIVFLVSLFAVFMKEYISSGDHIKNR